jgi:hypothetical protein
MSSYFRGKWAECLGCSHGANPRHRFVNRRGCVSFTPRVPKRFRSSSPRRALAAFSEGHHGELPMGPNSGNKTVRAGTPEGRAESMLDRAENRRPGDFSVWNGARTPIIVLVNGRTRDRGSDKSWES